MFVTKALRATAAAAQAERTPMIKFLGKRTIPTEIDHTPHAHPMSPSKSLPSSFTNPSPNTFSSYRQQAIQHGPLGQQRLRAGQISGKSLGPVQPKQGEYFDRNELPARFRRTKFSVEEIDAIETAGATMVC